MAKQGGFKSRKNRKVNRAFASEKPAQNRLDTNPTPHKYLLETLLSDPVPESEWPEEDRAMILEGLQQMPGSTVHKRPDGSLTIMGPVEFD